MNALQEEVKRTDEINGCLPADRLRSLIERIEHLEEEKSNLSADIRDIYAEAKSTGFDCKAIRAVIKLRKMNQADREQQEYILETYCNALGM